MENIAHGERIIEQLRTEELFLNVDDPFSDVWKWVGADILAFDCEDIEGKISHVRDFLRPFDKVLTAVGVLRVHHPQFRPSVNFTNVDSVKLQMIRDGYDKLRKQKALVDVVFVTADDPNKSDSSTQLVAHRSFLAVTSDYFFDSFSGGFREASNASSDQPVEHNVSNHSYQCVQSILGQQL